MSENSAYLFGLLATENLIIQNTTQPERLRFHIIIPKGEIKFFESKLSLHFLDSVIEFRIKESFL